MRDFNEQGSLGGVEGLAFGVLLFVFGTLMVATAWTVIDTKLATSAAAREAARAYVESNNEDDAVDEATAAATKAMQGHGRGAPDVAVNTTGFSRCNEVEVIVSATITRISLPLIGGMGGTTSVSSGHTEVIDPYRSGLTGNAAC